MASTAYFLSTAFLGLLLLHCVQAECQYFYTEEPPAHIQLNCNPYYGKFGLSCTVAVNVTLGSRDLNIQWFYIPSGARDSLHLKTFDFPPMGPSNEFIALQSRLEVTSHYAIEQLAGTYYCQAVLEGGEPLQQSRQTVVEVFSDSYDSSCLGQLYGLPTMRCAENESMDAYTFNPSLPPLYMTHIIDLGEIFNRNSTESTMPLPGCTYQYLTQPPLQPTCNPYVRNRLNLACTVFIHGPVAFNVAWFFVPVGKQPQILTQDFTMAGLGSFLVTMQITIINVQPGSYYCQVNPEGREPLQQSSQTVVGPVGIYDNLTTCDGQDYLTDQSVMCLLEQETTSTNTISGSGLITDTSTFDLNNLTDPSPTINVSPESTGSAEATEITIESTPMASNSDLEAKFSLSTWMYAVAASGGVIVVLLLVIVPLVLICYYRRRRRRRLKLIRKSKTIKVKGASTATSITNVHSDTAFINPVNTPSAYCNPRSPDEAPYYSQLHVQWPGDDDDDASLNSEVPYYNLPSNPAIYLGVSESNVYVTPNSVGGEWGGPEDLEVDASVYQEPNGTADSSSEEKGQYTRLNTMDYLTLYTPCETVRRKKRPVAAPRACAAARTPRHEDPLEPPYQTLDPSKMQLGGPYATLKY